MDENGVFEENASQLNLSSAAAAVGQLNDDCDEILREIHKIHKSAAKFCEPEPTVNVPNVRVKILQAKERKLHAEIKSIEEATMKALSTNKEVKKAVLKDNLETSIKQHEELLSCMEYEKQVLKEKLKKKKLVLEKQKEVKQAIEKKVQELESAHQGPDRYIREAIEKKEQMAEYLDQIDSQLSDFLIKHFPSPESKDLLKGIHKVTPSRPKYTNIYKIIRKLMKKQLDSPHDPYISIIDSYWPMYIELLIRHGIVLRHPQRSDHIRLTPFHL